MRIVLSIIFIISFLTGSGYGLDVGRGLRRNLGKVANIIDSVVDKTATQQNSAPPPSNASQYQPYQSQSYQASTDFSEQPDVLPTSSNRSSEQDDALVSESATDGYVAMERLDVGHYLAAVNIRRKDQEADAKALQEGRPTKAMILSYIEEAFKDFPTNLLKSTITSNPEIDIFSEITLEVEVTVDPEKYAEFIAKMGGLFTKCGFDHYTVTADIASDSQGYWTGQFGFTKRIQEMV